MSSTFVQQLERNGPDRCEMMSVEQARASCARLAGGHYENFTVLSRFVPADRRDDFAAVYAFCRWSDDLGDEVGDRARSTELLKWWRDELRMCYAGEPRHPVFIALQPTITRHDLPVQPFSDLISAFEMDQVKTRYESWKELLEYCRLSADPVGRLVLMVLGEPRTDETFRRSDAVCTALQLTNHWQDVRRDILERDRIYIPTELHSIRDFESRLRRSAKLEHACDQSFLGEYRKALKECCERTWKLFERGEPLLADVSERSQPIIWLFVAGGERILRAVEMWNYETCLHRPRLSKAAKVLLLLSARRQARRAVRAMRAKPRA